MWTKTGEIALLFLILKFTGFTGLAVHGLGCKMSLTFLVYNIIKKIHKIRKVDLN